MLRKIKQKIIRKVSKQYKNLVNSENNLLIVKILYDFKKENISSIDIWDSFFFKENIEKKNQIIKQYFFSHFIFENKIFSRSLLYFCNINKPGIFLLPVFALKVLKNNNVKINYLLSVIFFKLYELLKLLKSFFFFLKIIYKSIYQFLFSKNYINRGLYFFNTVEKILPSKKNGCDMITSIIRNENLNNINKKSIYSDCKKKYKNINDVDFFDIHILYDFRSTLIFFFQFLILFIYGILSFFSNKWYISFLLEEKIRQILINLANKKNLPSKIYFNQTSFIYRPMWTYENYKKKFEISMILYSSNYYDSEFYNFFLELMNWPEYFVSSRNYKSKLEQILNYKFNTVICDYIGWNDTDKILKKKFDITIFDDEPFRIWYQTTFLVFDDHRTEAMCTKFITDLLNTLKNKNLKISIKLKKNNLNKTPKKYLKLFNNNKNFEFIDPSYPAHDLILSSRAVISFPFSSTACLAKKLNKPCVYYYPLKLNNKPWVDDGIKILQNQDQLTKWLEENNFLNKNEY
jgi:polysaccharide biosynthesis PFTS motif protein